MAKAPQQKNKNVGHELNKMQNILQTNNQGIPEPILLQKKHFISQDMFEQ